jgi:hypothetical protein
MRDQPVSRLLPAHRTTRTQNKRTQTFTPQVEFDHKITEFERAKRVHASDRAATVIDLTIYSALIIGRKNERNIFATCDVLRLFTTGALSQLKSE